MAGLLIFAAPRISRDGFTAVLRAARSPALPESDAMYTAAADRGADPAVLLAFFHHESQYGTHPNAITVTAGKNAGALRAGPRAFQIKNGFAWYRRWADGAADWADLLLRYAADGVTSVEQTAPIYAPAWDHNSPPAYIAAVKADVARWQLQYPPAPPDIWETWGSVYALPEAERSFGIPQAWLAEHQAGRMLGAATTPEMHGEGCAARAFLFGCIIWHADGNRIEVRR